MSDLKSFVALQAQVWEFLDRQDDATLRRIAGGAAQLMVLSAVEQAVRALPDISSPPERRNYLQTADLLVSDLRKIAGELHYRNYSKLTKPKLIDLLADQAAIPTDVPAAEPKRPAPAPPTPVAEDSVAEPPATVPVTTGPDADAAAIAARLREIDTEEEGAEYLEAQHLDRDSLLAVATELQLTRMDRLSQKELRRRILKQAIGARRKFAGLRKW
ncbi:hypothetical protein DMA12_22810 [Amycolatopsis balhimycina DSM 5908]|uniref:Rho termination factor N-terminal domain-containing protein n=1 Tax=Amycolatopsis balhimycina DSM 5908 TaxID=1081091 RepID=A0A428WG66_AMYBA|nr:hypothetical protein [Amycolatopsis balhimycina]RSM42075.1 hypothetical protein DMA12_22810 [Amycolatopsis balhimycina DSM 5908]